jgi:hypothetical protein
MSPAENGAFATKLKQEWEAVGTDKACALRVPIEVARRSARVKSLIKFITTIGPSSSNPKVPGSRPGRPTSLNFCSP